MNGKIDIYLKNFAEIAKEYFESEPRNVISQYDNFFKNTFNKNYIENLNWKKVTEIASKFHSFNALPLARSKAINPANNDNDIEKFKTTFNYLIKPIESIEPQIINSEIEKRLKNVLKDKEYKLNYWGLSAISEIIGQKFPNDFVFFNHRDREAIKFLEIDLKKTNDLEKYIEYQEAIKPIIKKYQEIVWKKYQSGYDIGIEVDQFFSWIYENQVSSIELEKYLKSILIQNYFTIKEIKLENLESNEIYLLGENGVGKTILLQSIFLATKGNFIKKQTPSEISEVLNVLKTNENLELEAFSTDDEVAISNSTDDENYFPNILAYGTYRNNLNEQLKLSYDFLTLFSQNYRLTHPVDWLSELFYKDNISKIKSGIKLKQAIEVLEDLLHENVKIKVEKGEFKPEVSFYEKETKVKFEQLADGYKSVLIWVVDMVARLFKIPQNVKKNETKDLHGIVLIDELDLFLHPKWSYEIVKKLKRWFPKIQFIISTHSPILTLGASKEAIFYKLYKEDGETKISEPYKIEDFANKLINGFVTSPLFDLPTAKSASYDSSKHDFETGDYIYEKIHKEVKGRLVKKPLQDNEITDIINDLLDKYEKEGTL